MGSLETNTADMPATRDEETETSAAPTGKQARAAFERDVNAVVAEVCRLDRNRNVLYRILDYCREQRDADDVERFIAGLPEMRHAFQEPYVYMDLLVDAHGLEAIPLDAAGNPIEQLVSQEHPDIADAAEIAQYRITTTPAGVRALQLVSPEARLHAKLGEHPERYSTYLAVLDFCKQPRSLAEVQRLFEQDASLNRETTVDAQPLSCDFYLSELERAGGLVWNGGWTATQEGVALLES